MKLPLKLPLKLPGPLTAAIPVDCARRTRFRRPRPCYSRVRNHVRIGVTFV